MAAHLPPEIVSSSSDARAQWLEEQFRKPGSNQYYIETLYTDKLFEILLKNPMAFDAESFRRLDTLPNKTQQPSGTFEYAFNNCAYEYFVVFPPTRSKLN
jgi:hypothetical protein